MNRSFRGFPGLFRRLGITLLLVTGFAGCGDTANVEVAEVSEDDHVDGHEAVRLDSAAIAIAGITVGVADAVSAIGLPVTGTITYDANRVSHIGPSTEGRVVRLAADLGQRVGAGTVLARLESPVIAQLRSEEGEARVLVEIAREHHEREKRLEAQGISSRRELLEAQAALQSAEAALTSASARLGALGGGQGEGGGFAVVAPFPGVVVAREASLGEMVGPADQLFTVADLTTLWLEMDIYERDLSRVATDLPVEVTTAALPGRSFPGRIAYVGDILDPATRTVRARVELPNENGALKPGMFATATIRAGEGDAASAAVPLEAVQEVEGSPSVFVPGDEPGEFVVRPVEVGAPIEGDRILIRSGLRPGDAVVTAGAFTLRSELASGEIGEAGHAH